MKEIKKEERSEKLITELLNVWEDSVRATHNFLSNEEIEKNVVVENIDYKMVKYVLKQDEGMYREFVIYINPSNFTFDYQEKEYECIYGKIDNGQIEAKTIVILAK